MANIIAARFDTQAQADSALAALRSAGVAATDSTSFFLNPPGQHAIHPVGGDAHHSEGTKDVPKGAAKAATIGSITGLALGTATGAALGEPGFTAAGAIAGAGVGGFVGSLVGGVSSARQSDADQSSREEPAERASGIIVAVSAGSVAEDELVRVLRAQGALEIERAQGEWRDGTWADFDPRRTPDLIGVAHGADPRGPAGSGV